MNGLGSPLRAPGAVAYLAKVTLEDGLLDKLVALRKAPDLGCRVVEGDPVGVIEMGKEWAEDEWVGELSESSSICKGRSVAWEQLTRGRGS